MFLIIIQMLTTDVKSNQELGNTDPCTNVKYNKVSMAYENSNM